MKWIYNIIKIIILLAFLIIAIGNTQLTDLYYLPGQSVKLPLIVALFGVFVVGVLFGMFALFGRLMRLRSENNRLRLEVKKSARISEQDLTVPTANPPTAAKE